MQEKANAEKGRQLPKGPVRFIYENGSYIGSDPLEAIAPWRFWGSRASASMHLGSRSANRSGRVLHVVLLAAHGALSEIGSWRASSLAGRRSRIGAKKVCLSASSNARRITGLET